MSAPALYRHFTSQEQLDEEYDPSRAVADSDAVMERFLAESERARAELECRLDVPYGPTRAERLDLFPAGPDAPVLAFIHGGYWRARSAKDFSCVALGPVAAGIAVAVIEYALAPTVRLTEIVRQCRAAVARLHESTGQRIHVAGHSAGGHLTAMVMATDWERDYRVPADVVASGCGISGLYDLAPFPYTYLQPALQLSCDEVLALSPIRHLPDRAGPLLITYGGRESAEFHRQSEDFLAAWRERGLPGERFDQPEADHYTVIDGLLERDSPLTAALVEQLSAAR